MHAANMHVGASNSVTTITTTIDGRIAIIISGVDNLTVVAMEKKNSIKDEDLALPS